MSQYYIGVDGGGTHTTVLVTDSTGKRICLEEGDSLHYHSLGYETARRNLFDILDRIFSKIPVSGIAFLYIGMSAIEFEATQEEIERFLGGRQFSFPVWMHTDAYTALLGHTLGKAGAILISGTGSVAYGMDGQGEARVFGGWGPLLGDEGSAYDLGRRAIGCALRSADGIEERTMLLEEMKDYFHLTYPRELSERNLTRKQIAGFAVKTAQCALQGDHAAMKIVDNAVDCLVDLGKAAVIFSGEKELGIYGGMLQNDGIVRRRFFEAAKQKGIRVTCPQLPPQAGAILAGMKKQGFPLNDMFLQTIKAEVR